MKLSIITINRNNRKGLQLTIDSIICQTYQGFEWIIIDGASTDGSKELIEQYADYITYWISEPDSGVYNAMNKGIRVARGEYCLFMNSGDRIYHKETLEATVPYINSSQYHFISGNTQMVCNERIIGNSQSPQNITGCYLYSKTLCHQSTFINTKTLKQEYYDEKLKFIADWAQMFEQLILKDATYLKLNHFISVYDTTGLSSTNYSLNFAERVSVIKKLLPLRIKEDYERFTTGKTPLEKVIHRIGEQSLAYKAITYFALLIFAPISLKRRLSWKLTKTYKKIKRMTSK